jgi:DNA polymerase elongation subunit (family B)
MSRRDNCRYLKKIFKKIFLMILMRKPLQEILNELVDAVLFLMQRRVPMKDLEIVKKVGNEYKSASNPLAILSTTLKDYGKPVDPGDRIEYVFIESEEKKQGYKLLTPEMVIAKGERIDTAYTMEKQLVNPLDQLLKLGFKDKFEGVTKGKMYLAKFHKDITWKKKMLIQVKEAYVIITKRREMMKKKQMRKIIVT